MYALSLPYAVTKIAKKFGVAFRCAAYSPGEDFELILTVKMETRYPGHYAGNPFGREFSEFVIIWELWRSEVARSGNFLSNFCVVWEIRPLMVKLSKLSFRNFTWRHRLTLLCSNVVKCFPRKIGEVLLFTAQKIGCFSNCRYCGHRAQNLPEPAPNIWLTIFQTSSKSDCFWRSYSRTHKGRSFGP